MHLPLEITKKYKKYQKIAFLNPTKPHCKSSFHKTVATELLFKTKSSIRILRINIKCTGTNEAIILGAQIINPKKFKKPSSGCSIYKTSSKNGIESESRFFGTKMRAFSEAQS